MTCSFEGCDKPAKSLGMCMPHYKASRPPCSFEGCERPIESAGQGLCAAHAQQRRKGQPLKPAASRARRGTSTKTYKPGLPAAIRAWAVQNGYDVPQTGKIPWQVERDYWDSH